MSDYLNKLVRMSAFTRLEQLLGRFNFFYATSMAAKEVKHTKFLAYLLTPNESHGLKEEFLRRFLTSLPSPDDSKGVILNVFDCDLSHALVHTELSLGSEQIKDTNSSINSGARFDILIQIPSIRCHEKFHIIAIENKLNAKQGCGQLEKYTKSINQRFSDKVAGIHYVYLNLRGDEEVPAEWANAKYSETIIPVVESILVDMDEVISDYLAYILKDYREVLIREGGGVVSTDADILLGDIFNDSGAVAAIDVIKNDDKLKISMEWARFLYEYGRAWKIVEKYNNDYRLSILKHYRGCFRDGVFSLVDGVRLRLESSSVKWMRCSFLEDDVAERFQSICRSSDTRRWVESARNLCFELCFSEPDENKQVSCRLTLTLGPTNPNYPLRSELYNCIRNALTGNIGGESAVPASKYYSSIKRGYFGKVVFIGNAADGVAWVDSVLSDLAADKGGSIKRINYALRQFFMVNPDYITSAIGEKQLTKYPI